MTDTPHAARLLALAGSLALSACAHSSTAPNEASAMSTPVTSPATTDASSLLRSLLDLVRQTASVKDLTPERLEAGMHHAVQAWGGSRFGFNGGVAPDWNYMVDVDQAGMNGPSLHFAFVPAKPETSPDATDICGMDFDAFDRALREAGFSGAPYYGEHGRIVWQTYQRIGMTLDVMYQGESARNATHRCVTSVSVR